MDPMIETVELTKRLGELRQIESMLVDVHAITYEKCFETLVFEDGSPFGVNVE